MKISELQPKQGNIEVTGEVTEVQEPRTFNKFGKEGRVTNAVLKDESGQVKLTLWNEQVEQVKQGDNVTIKNGYVNEWQGEMQLTTGKFGTMEVLPAVEKAAGQEQEKKEKPSEAEEEPLGD